MSAELIAVGTELLGPTGSDSNGDWLAARLEQARIRIRGRCRVADDEPRIATAVVSALASGELTLITGGLGPTEDDRTRPAIARALDVDLETDPSRVERLRRWFAARRAPFPENAARQATRPAGAEWIDNPLGSAPGFWIRRGRAAVIALPGVPAEMRRMFRESVAPRLDEFSKDGPVASRVLRIVGPGESSVDARVRDLLATGTVDWTILGGVSGIALELRAAAEALLDPIERSIRARLGDDVWGTGDETLPEVVGRMLERTGRTLAVAESCTAGGVASALTEVAGASAWFRGGLVVYHDDLKTSLAGVPADTLASHGAVSKETARALAKGARSSCRSDIGVGVTGIAGPGGASRGKPVGLVYVALDHEGGAEHSELRLSGDRRTVRLRTVTAVLDRLRRHLA